MSRGLYFYIELKLTLHFFLPLYQTDVMVSWGNDVVDQ